MPYFKPSFTLSKIKWKKGIVSSGFLKLPAATAHLLFQCPAFAGFWEQQEAMFRNPWVTFLLLLEAGGGPVLQGRGRGHDPETMGHWIATHNLRNHEVSKVPEMQYCWMGRGVCVCLFTSTNGSYHLFSICQRKRRQSIFWLPSFSMDKYF